MKKKLFAMTRGKIDILVIIAFTFLAILYSSLTRDMFIGRSLFSGMVLTIPSAIYLGLRKKKNWRKIILATLTFGVLFGFALSFYAEATESWRTNDYIFNFRFFGLNTLEEVIGHGLMALITFTFYEHFVDKGKDETINKKYGYAIITGVVGALTLLIIHKYSPTFLPLKYPYLLVGIIAIMPTLYTVWQKPSFLPKLALTSLFFFFYWFAVQFQAVAFEYWSYPGNYIGWINIGNVSYPFEELFFWMLLYSPTIVAYYELTMDDWK